MSTAGQILPPELKESRDEETEVFALINAIRRLLATSAGITAVLDMVTSTRGSVLYRGASGWAALAPGTAGWRLTTNGAGADPTWAP